MQMKRKNKPEWKMKAAALVLFILFFLTGFGKQIPTVNQIMKTPVGYGSGSILVGSSSTALVGSVITAKDYDIQNTVALKYDLNTDTFFLNKTTLKVKVDVKHYNALGA